MDKPAYLPERLTDQQLEAILHHNGPLLIIAGPGSGKTEVISWRVAHLIRAGHATPEQLLVITFANKAALELKDRVHKNLQDIDVENMHISTIHSFCADLLREYSGCSPFPNGFNILDESAQLLFVFSNRKALGLSGIVKGKEYDFYSCVRGVFNQATEEDVTPDALLTYCEGKLCECGEAKSDLWKEKVAIARAYEIYSEMLLCHRLVDFAFLQRHALDMISAHPTILQELQNSFSEILVDEYQDTNVIQEQLIDRMVGRTGQLTVVGDDDQSIYRFRGATVKNILEFDKRHVHAHIVWLTQNFRSYEQIVDLSTRVIVQNPARYEKNLFTARGAGSDVLLVYQRTAAEEANQVVSLIERLYRAGRIRNYGDVALLLRSVRSYAEAYADALARGRIPFVVIRDGGFFHLDYIAQLRDLLTFLGATKPWGDKHVRHDIVGLSNDTREALKNFKADLITVNSAEALANLGVEDANDRHILLALLSLKTQVQKRRYQSLLQVFYQLLAAIGYFAHCEREGHAGRLCNLGLFSKLIANFDEYGRTRNYYQFLEYLKLLRQGGIDPVPETNPDAVQIMTIHQAKGLEFPVVVLGAAMNGRLPTRRRTNPYEIPASLRASSEPEVSDPHLVDERKLFYVAATRAQELLIVGTADVVNKRGGGPSIFVREMFGQDLKAAAKWAEVYIQDIESRGDATSEPRQRLSYSQLAYFLQCPVRYKYSVLYGMVSALPELTYFGANVHRALEELHNRAREGLHPSEAMVEDIVSQTWVAGPAADAKKEEARKRHAIEWIRKYIREHGEDFSRIIAAETGFSYSVGDSILVGKVDLIRESPQGGVEIVDFKASSRYSDAKERTDMQLAFYALGVEGTLAYKVQSRTAHFLGDGSVDSWPWSTERAASTQAGLCDVLDTISRQEFTPRSEYCTHCDEFRAICPYARVG